jgi:hypothetical protein
MKIARMFLQLSRLFFLMLQAPVGLLLMGMGIFPFTEGINACFHNTPTPLGWGIFYCLAGLAVCFAGFRLFAGAMSDPEGGQP